jgi:hypothetical protein
MNLFAEKFPERFVEIGIAEQNLASVASGMSAMGKIPYISSYAMFSPGRNWEQIRTTICYNNNTIEYIPPNVFRRLEQIKNGQNIYNDSQNVHNHHIQESIRKSINNILRIKPLITDFTDLILNDPILTQKNKRNINRIFK